MPANWSNVGNVEARSFTCGHCGIRTGNDRGFRETEYRWKIYLCPSCERPTFFEEGKQIPGPPFGNEVEHLSPDIASIFKEARAAHTAGAHTASVMTCRKILMNVAVSLGAEEGKPFAAYVEWLLAEHHLPPNAKGWLDYIRLRANEANHEIRLNSQEDSERLITLVEMLLKIVYELPSTVPRAEEESAP